MRVTVVVVACAAAVVVACLRQVSYECTDDSFCVRDGVHGRCEATSFCSFQDPSCDSGWRYANTGALAQQCVSGTGFSVGGNAAGLAGSGLVLQNNGVDTLAVATNGPFMFASPVATGSAYDVVVIATPANQQCTVTNASGTVATAPITDIEADCTAAGNGVVCGGSNCGPLGTEKCCHDSAGGSAGVCTANATACPAGDIDQLCDDSGDCGGLPKVCCAHLTSTGAIKSAISCVSGPSNCHATGSDTVEFLCDPNASQPCSTGMTCVADAMHGWYFCQ